MLSELKRTERTIIRNHYSEQEHPLFLACDDVFYSRSSHLNAVDIEAENIFVGVAHLLDELFKNEGVTQRVVDRLWAELFKDIRVIKMEATEHDKQQVTHTIFAIVRKLMCHHWNSQYCYKLYDMLGVTISREMRDSDKKELEQFSESLFEHSEGLDDWINCAYDGNLSGEIETLLKGKKSVKPKKPSGRKSIDIDSIEDTFKVPLNISKRMERIRGFYNSMDKVYVAADQKVFIDTLSGTKSKSKITWTGDIKELHYMINKLVGNGWIEVPDSYTKWQITCARFNIRVKGNNGKPDEIKDFQLSQFSNINKPLKDHPKLDKIINILNPRIDIQQAMDDYLGYLALQGEHDEINDTNDALAHGLNTDIHI